MSLNLLCYHYPISQIEKLRLKEAGSLMQDPIARVEPAFTQSRVTPEPVLLMTSLYAGVLPVCSITNTLSTCWVPNSVPDVGDRAAARQDQAWALTGLTC